MSDHRTRQREFTRIVGRTLESGNPISRNTDTEAKRRAEVDALNIKRKRQQRSQNRHKRDESRYSI